MAKLVLLLIAAAWAAVLIPPLLRSRIENRPNNSVSDFRDQLSSLQKAVPARSVQMRIGRGLVSSSLERPVAAGRPSDGRTRQRTHDGAPRQATLRSVSPTARAASSAAPGEPRVRTRTHASSVRHISARELQKRRRANVLFVLVLATGCSLFLAATTEATAAVYGFVLAFLALAGYVYLLGQQRQRDGEERLWRREPRVRDRWLDVA
jgi:hypothetical protein